MSSKKKDTRRRILKAALETMEASPNQVSTGQIAKLAGVSRQAVYLHFRNKNQLVIEVARYTDEHFDLEGHLAPVRRATNANELLKAQAQFLAIYNPLIYPVVRSADAIRSKDPDVQASWADRLANRRVGCHWIARKLFDWECLAEGWSIKLAGDWLTGQASVKLWEELVIDLGWSSKKYASTHLRAMMVLVK